jgi:acyl carrier protein
MTNETRDLKVKTVIANACGLMLEDVKPENLLDENLGLDSLDGLNLMMALEDEFEIEIADTTAEKIETVGEVLEYIAKVAPNA